jgi:hypothetical protein
MTKSNMTVKSWAKQYSKRNNLVFKYFGMYHYRVSNGKRYVDFWDNGSFRKVNGEFMTVTNSHSGLNETNDYKNCPEIVEEIKSLNLI